MTRVNTLKDIEAIYLESLKQQSDSLILENQTVGKQSAGEELEDEKKASKAPEKEMKKITILLVKQVMKV